MSEENKGPVEIWAGFECTVNRVQRRYMDQIVKTGHQNRLEDLGLLADLGVKTVRYPVIWERVSPMEGEFDWTWTDERLNRLRELGIKPILGLLHHGSGPTYTSLIDPRFPEKLAAYARAVAERYPWAEMYTPVNEPLTTARFSCLYGHWYPHAQGDIPFGKALLHQMKGTVLAMRAIREVNPSAKLVQTEDLGKTHSTPLLAYQAHFENERRWVSFDLLAARLTTRSLLWKFIAKHCGVSNEELQWFLENPCPPDILGINYYVTSERYLDDRIERYPVKVLGGNGKHAYADVEAVRARVKGIAGPKQLLEEAWQRFGLPLAITEAHLGCTREEQVRWFAQAVESARSVKAEGADVRAVTAWSLLGAYDWDSLLTRSRGHYESGVFDVRSGKPRATALVETIKALVDEGKHDHPCHSVKGWWERPVRFEYPVVRQDRSLRHTRRRSGIRPVLITGETGTLGRAFARLCELRGLPYVLSNRAHVDISSCESVAKALDCYEPWAVVNTAGYVRVDDAEGEPERCFSENTEGPQVLAELCGDRKIGLATFSSDLVFDGKKKRPYVESDSVSPLNVYGKSKAIAEQIVLETNPHALVIRTSAFFGPWDEHNYVINVLRALARGEVFLAGDGCISPTYVPDLVNSTLDLLMDRESGIWHLANKGEVTWTEFGRMAADLFGLDPAMVLGMSGNDLPAPRPAYSVLGTEKGQIMPDLEAALEKFAEKLEIEWAPAVEPLRKRALVL